MEEVNEISNHITKYSINILSKSIIDATFSEVHNEYSHVISLVWVVQMFELFIKSKIFQKNNSLIFEDKNNIDFFNWKTIGILDSVKIFKKEFCISINNRCIKEIIKKRNQLVHFWINNHDYVDTSKIVLKFIFEIITPILEMYYKDDLEYLFDCLWNRDDCIFENRVIEQLNDYWIKYSNLIKNKFTYK